MNDIKAIAGKFPIEGKPLDYTQIKSGHINQTYLLVTNRPHLYILQGLNTSVFPNIPGLMNNLIAVTDHLRTKTDDPRRALQLVPTVDGQPYLSCENGEYWRMYEFVLDSLCLEKPETADDLYQSGIAFGQFQNQLADFPAETLSETIPRFHDTPDRYRLFHEAIKADKAGRLKDVQAEVDAYLAYEKDADALMSLCRSGELPLRVTHNDTKLNNVMLDAKTGEGVCVIDLDTVMPGSLLYDFGDALRFGGNSGAEDETDLSKIYFRLDYFEAFVRGFVQELGSKMTKREIELLPFSVKLMTYECGIRFLTDYLN